MRGLLALTLGYAAVAFGGVEGSTQFVLSVMASLLLALVAWRLFFEPRFRLEPSWMWVPLGLLIVEASLQLVPFPASVVEVVSPARMAQYEPVLGDESPPERVTLSSAPSATRRALRLALLASAILVAVTSCVKKRRDVEFMLTVVFGVGCLEAILAVAQIATGADKLYGVVDPGERGMMTAGSFVNHSHFSQLVNLAIGAGVGLLLMRLHLAEGRARLACRVGWILAGLALCTFAVCLSHSRGGILSLVLALGLAGSVLTLRQGFSRRGWMLLSVCLGTFLMLLLFGLEGFYDRLATLGQQGQYGDRWALTKASLAAGADYPWLGTGLGTFAHAFPAYDTTGSTSVAAYADNDYAQIFVEAGLAGLAILMLLLLLVVRALVTCLNSHDSPSAQAAWGVMIGLVAVGIHSATDFGQRLPGVFLVTVTLLGILSVLPTAIRHERTPAELPPARRRRVTGWGVRLTGIVVTATAMAWVVEGAYAQYQGERWWATALRRETRLREQGWLGTDDEYADLLVAAENRVLWEPDNAEAHFQLNLYRWLSVNRSAVIAHRAGDLPAKEQGIAERIVQELKDVRLLEPCFAAPQVLEGQLRTYVIGDEQGGGRLIAHAARLDVGNPQVQFRYGEWSAYFGSADAAKEALRRAVEVDARGFAPAAHLLINVLNDLPAAIAWGGDDLERLETIASLLEANPGRAEELAELRAQMEQLELRLASRGRASPLLLSKLGDRAAKVGDYAEAVTFYRQALSKQYHLIKARLGLAHSLRAQGRYDEALEEVMTCLRHDPHNAEARGLAGQLALEVSLPAGSR